MKEIAQPWETHAYTRRDKHGSIIGVVDYSIARKEWRWEIYGGQRWSACGGFEKLLDVAKERFDAKLIELGFCLITEKLKNMI
jgi:hypothetical protein